MDKRTESLRLTIQGRWSTTDLTRTITSINELYNLSVLMLLVKDHLDLLRKARENSSETINILSPLSELTEKAAHLEKMVRSTLELFHENYKVDPKKFSPFLIQIYLTLMESGDLNFRLNDFHKSLESRLKLADEFCKNQLLTLSDHSTSPILTLISNPQQWDRLSETISPQEQLRIIRIQYGSPGFIDLLGIGEAIKNVNEFLTFLIEKWLSREQRSHENVERRLRNEILRIEIIRHYLSILQECGADELILRHLIPFVLIRLEILEPMIKDDLLSSVELLQKESSSEEEKPESGEQTN